MPKAHRLRAVALTLWLVVILLTPLAAGLVFVGYSADAAKANVTMAAALQLGGRLCVGVGLLAVACEACLLFAKTPALPHGEGGARRYVSPLLAMVALAAAIVTALWLDPQILEAWEQIKGFGASGAGDPALMRFRCLLGASFGMLLLQASFVAMALLLKAKQTAAAGNTAA